MISHEDIIGLHYGHDATAVLLRDGAIVEAMSEERFSRQKKHIGFPERALSYLKKKYDLTDIRHVYVVGAIPSDIINWTADRNREERARRTRKQDWILRAGIARFDIARAAFREYKRVLHGVTGKEAAAQTVGKRLAHEFPHAAISYVDHHLAHAWSAVPFFPSFNERRIIVTLDGEGDDHSGLVGIYDHGKIEIFHTFPNTHSLGLLYSSVVDVLGMARNEHEFKVMGLAPYAKPSAGERAYEELAPLLRFDRSTMQFVPALDMRNATAYLVAHNINTAHRFDALAYGIQKLTETLTDEVVMAAVSRYGTGAVAVGGGVFMNVKANQRLAARKEITSFVITPSCGDESLAIGAAVYGYAALHGNDLSELSSIPRLYLGSEYSDAEIHDAIERNGYQETCEVNYIDPKDGITIEQKVADLLAQNEVVGRFKGRAEWGARALGNRSILANPSSRENVKLINEMIKGRDFWMPFATSILREESERYLINPTNSDAPYMAITFDTTPEAHEHLEAALHPYDLTSRPQMVHEDANPEYYALIRYFRERTGIGGVLNTSFNLHGEPNVETPEDALRTFAHSGLPYLAIGNYLLSKRR